MIECKKVETETHQISSIAPDFRNDTTHTYQTTAQSKHRETHQCITVFLQVGHLTQRLTGVDHAQAFALAG